MRRSYDFMRMQCCAKLAERDAAKRVHAAKLRVPHAEGRAEALIEDMSRRAIVLLHGDAAVASECGRSCMDRTLCLGVDPSQLQQNAFPMRFAR